MKYAHYPARPGMTIVPIGQSRAQTGLSKSEQYRRINEGTHPPPVKTGPRSAGLPSYVLDDYNAARAAGEIFDCVEYLKRIGGQLIES